MNLLLEDLKAECLERLTVSGDPSSSYRLSISEKKHGIKNFIILCHSMKNTVQTWCCNGEAAQAAESTSNFELVYSVNFEAA